MAGSINFSNLSIAASVRRQRNRCQDSIRLKQLLLQIAGEIALQCIISPGFAVLLVIIILPYFNRQFTILLTLFDNNQVTLVWAQIALCLLGVILLSGLYPGVFLSRYNITKVLKGDDSTGTKGIAFRNALIVVQLTVSVFFITSTLVVKKQMQYIQTGDRDFSWSTGYAP